MSKQVLFYENVVPVSGQRHKDWSIERGNYAFAEKVNSVPIMAVEIPRAASDYAIVFSRNEDQVAPVVLLGVENEQNTYVNDEGEWTAKYIPAFVRRYPFVFSQSEDGKSFTLCIDESWKGCNQDDKGERLFDDKGERAPFLDGMLKFMEEFQRQFLRTQQFGKRLIELDLLNNVQARITTAGGETKSLGGLLAVDREKLKALPDEKLAEMARTDELELIYTHLTSLSNVATVVEKATAGV